MLRQKNDLAKGIFVLVAIAVVAVFIIVQQTTKISVQQEHKQLTETTRYAQTSTESYFSLV